jgi:dsDNA-specific endonuclease/ATPase MutS2
MSGMAWIVATVVLILALRALGRRLPGAGPRPPTSVATTPEPELPAVEIGDELDLHGVPEADVDMLVDAFVDVAFERRLSQAKIIHGKGIGARRQRVRARLARHPQVLGWRDAETPGSGWGATVVQLRNPSLGMLAKHGPPTLG